MSFNDVIASGNFVVLDTETTGVGRAEIVSAAIIDSRGQTLLDTLVKPVNPIPYASTRIHGITDRMVVNAPSFAAVLPELQRLLTDTNVIVYNAVFDRKMLHQSAEAAGLPKTDWKALSEWHCAMTAFAEVYGDWNAISRSYRWQKLETACRYYSIPVVGAHGALADCRMTLAVCQKMAGVAKSLTD